MNRISRVIAWGRPATEDGAHLPVCAIVDRNATGRHRTACGWYWFGVATTSSTTDVRCGACLAELVADLPPAYQQQLFALLDAAYSEQSAVVADPVATIAAEVQRHRAAVVQQQPPRIADDHKMRATTDRSLKQAMVELDCEAAADDELAAVFGLMSARESAPYQLLTAEVGDACDDSCRDGCWEGGR